MIQVYYIPWNNSYRLLYLFLFYSASSTFSSSFFLLLSFYFANRSGTVFDNSVWYWFIRDKFKENQIAMMSNVEINIAYPMFAFNSSLFFVILIRVYAPAISFMGVKCGHNHPTTFTLLWNLFVWFENDIILLSHERLLTAFG